MIIYSLVSNDITSKGASQLFHTLRAIRSTISKLYMNGNIIGDDAMRPLGEYIKENQSIECISIGNNRISDKGIEILCPYLESNTMIKFIDIRTNQNITDRSIPMLIKMIEISRIENVETKGTSITSDNIFVPALVNNILKNRTEGIYFDYK